MKLDPQNINFSLTEREFQDGSRAIYLTELRRQAPFLIPACFAVCNLFYLVATQSDPSQAAAPQGLARLFSGTSTAMSLVLFNALLLCAVLLLVAVTTWSSYFRAGQRYRQSRDFFVETSWEPQDDGMIFRRGEDRITFPWYFFRRVYFTKDFLMLERQDRFAHLLPRRYFADGGKLWLEAINDRLRHPFDHEV